MVTFGLTSGLAVDWSVDERAVAVVRVLVRRVEVLGLRVAFLGGLGLDLPPHVATTLRLYVRPRCIGVGLARVGAVADRGGDHLHLERNDIVMRNRVLLIGLRGVRESQGRVTHGGDGRGRHH